MSSSDSQQSSETACVRVQLVSEFGEELPFIDTKVKGVSRRYYIGEPGQQFAVRADYSTLIERDGGASSTGKFVISCDIDGQSVGTVYLAGRSAQLYPYPTRCSFDTFKRDGTEYKLQFAATQVSNAAEGSCGVKAEATDSFCGRIKVAAYMRVDQLADPPKPAPAVKAVSASIKPPAAAVEEPPEIVVAASRKFWTAPGLSLSLSLPLLPPALAPAAAKGAGKSAAVAVLAIAPAHPTKWSYGAFVTQVELYYDTALRLALRNILLDTHALYPRDAVRAVEEAERERRANQGREAAHKEQLHRLVERLDNPVERSKMTAADVAVAKAHREAAEVGFCDLTDEDAPVVFHIRKKYKQEQPVPSAACTDAELEPGAA